MGCFIHKVHAFFKNHQHSWSMAETYTQSPNVLLNTAFPHPPSTLKNMVPSLPPGLNALYQTCRDVYPDQPNPIQVAAVIKYWLGGPDPLDYISIYFNKGDPERNIPEHWHYVTFGFSDLHGDGRVHPVSSAEGRSGFGFELTMRLKREADETGPPTWPAVLLQALARYVFQSENALFSGDHVSWHAALDSGESRLQHMLMTDDPQLPTVNTDLGTIHFVQVVGVCTEELQAAQQWNGPGVIELLKSLPVSGGPWLVTDMRRNENIFELDPTLQNRVDDGIRSNGSNLSGVSAKCCWGETSHENPIKSGDSQHNRSVISEEVSNQIKDAFLEGLGKAKHQVLPYQMHQTDGVKDSYEDEIPHELVRTRELCSVHLKFNLEAGSLLPLACKGRILHGRHFTFKSVNGDTAVTLVATGVEGAFVDETTPFASRGPWLQVLVTEELAHTFIRDLDEISSLESMHLPKVYRWPDKGLEISILPDDTFAGILPDQQFPT